MTSIELRVRVLLTLQVSLLGAITSNMRAVLVSWDEKNVLVRIIFEGLVSSGDLELVSEVESEVLSHLPDHLITCKAELHPDHGPIESHKHEVFVFRRAGQNYLTTNI